jgi:hypothetical protein
MADDESERRRIIDRANRMLRQSRALRKLADELRQESSELRVSGKRITKPHTRKKP